MELFGRHDLVGQADPQRLLGFDLAAAEAQLLGPARPDQAGETLGTAAAGDDAEQDLGLPEHRPLAGDPVVARQRQLAATAERVAADGGDDETGDGGDRVERLVEATPIDSASDGPPNSEMSAPAAKIRSPPVTTTAPGGSSVRSGRPPRNSASSALDSAFTLPLASVMTATPSARRSSSTPPASPIPPFCLLQTNCRAA